MPARKQRTGTRNGRQRDGSSRFARGSRVAPMNPPPGIDTLAARRAFARAAGGVTQADFLAREAESRMAERLDYLKFSPVRILDLGCGRGASLDLLASRYPMAGIIGIDASVRSLARSQSERGIGARLKRWIGRRPGTGMRATCCADMMQLPLAASSASMIWSNLALAWVLDPAAAFTEFARVLEPGGLLMFSTYGPDTLRELREAFAGIDSYSHTLRFVDMHDLGDMMAASGFATPVVDMQVITLTYPDVGGLVRDLRATGETNVAADRRRGLLAPSAWRRMTQAYEARRRDGRLPATIELVFGHAWKAETRRESGRLPDGRSPIRFDMNAGRRAAR